MEEVTDTNVYKYTTEVVVEIIGVDSDGGFAMTSHQFAVTENESAVQPKGEFDPEDRRQIEAALEDAGYVLEES
jgi:hypothetical protein